ncbi:MAG: hypothetical protein GX567_00890 [Clostridia bacterium]|nr:hypothetical protein [Clostridia bacterium]
METDKALIAKQEFLDSIKPQPYLTYKDYNIDGRWGSFLEIAKAMYPDFNLTPEEEKIYRNGVMYFAGDPQCEWSLNKGLYICGKIGVGKTTFFKILNTLNKAVGSGSDNSFRKYTSTELADGFEKKGFEYFENLGYINSFGYSVNGVAPTHLLLDDLGQSSNIVNHFGTTTNIVSEFIQRRYNVFIDRYKLTHISTNIEPSEIKEAYGEFIASRMREMFNIIIYPGIDRRK